MKRILILIATLSLAALSANASGTGIDLATASRTAMEFLSSRSGTRLATAPHQLWIHEEQGAARQAAYYIVSTDRGFVIVAGDSRVRQVLAYGDQSLEDIDAMPTAMHYFLELYRRQLDFLQSFPELELPARSRYDTDLPEKTVEPLLRSQWGQTNPYNFKCPKVDGLLTYVGCSAIALAQVMRYWEYPAACDSLPSYITRTLGMSVEALEGTALDWENMLDRYRIGGDHTTEQLNAVTTLLRYVGQAEHMDYRTTASDAGEEDILKAINTFRYDPDALYVEKSSVEGVTYYSDAIWETMLREELYCGRPVIYCGYSLINDSTSTLTGHAFNVDGYDANNDLYHVNFGWRGSGDGYFALNAFTLSNYNFNIGQLMFLKVMPPRTDPVMLPTDSAAVDTTCFHAQWTDETSPKLVGHYVLEVATTSDFDPDGTQHRLMEGITRTSCVIDSLTAGTTYYYRVQAIYIDGTASEWSNVETVTTPGHAYVLGDCNHDGIFGIADVTCLIDHILNHDFWVCPICADMKADGIIDISDVTTMIDYILGNLGDTNTDTDPLKP